MLNICSISCICCRANGQFPGLANEIWGKDSYLPGIKKIVGGILAADITHSKCGQKMLCDEMAPAVNYFVLHFIPVDYRKYDYYFKIIFQSLKYHISESRNDRGHRPCKKDDRTYSKISKTARSITLDWRCFGQHRMLLLKSFQI